MVKRTSLADATCAVARSLDVIGDWWSLLIIRDALDGKRRFGEFQRSLGIAKNVLTARLRALVEHGVLETVPAADGSAFSDYVLTDKGVDLFPVIVGLRQWGNEHLFSGKEPRFVLVDKAGGRPVSRLDVTASHGRPVGPDDTEIRVLPAAALATARKRVAR